ncbi:MAG: choice-of-anchor J domain-containing protein, partial [Candidatus Cloacimonetes bacterium]|nr:choice-of-anchor J domain-containing protein [Candidatus Cloacimonadota bacterium]
SITDKQPASFTEIGAVTVSGTNWEPYQVNISNYMNTDIYVAFHHQAPQGISSLSVFIDNVAIKLVDTLLQPNGIAAAVNGYNVNLTWNVPAVVQGYFTHTQANTYIGAYGLGGSAFTAAQRFTPAQLGALGAAGGNLTQVGFMPNLDVAHSYTVRVWVGGYYNNEDDYEVGALVHTQAVTQTLTTRVWNDITLSTPIRIPIDQELWFGLAITSPAPGSVYPMGYDNGPSVNGGGFGDLVFSGGEWGSLAELAGWDRNNAIRAYVSSGGAPVQLAHYSTPIDTRVTNTLIGSFRADTPTLIEADPKEVINNDDTRALVGYNVYRGATLMNPTPITARVYNDIDAPAGSLKYGVRAVYDTGISLPNETIAYVGYMPPVSLTATGGDGFVRLAWTRPTIKPTVTIHGYKVYRDGEPLTIDIITATNYTDNSAVPTVNHTYHVTTIYRNPMVESNPSNTATGMNTIPFELKYPPNNLTANLNENNVTLNWDVPEASIWFTHTDLYPGNAPTASGWNATAASPITINSANRFNAQHLVEMGVSGLNLTKVAFAVLNNPTSHILANCAYTVKVWTGGSAYPTFNPGTVVRSVAVPSSEISHGGWHEVDIPPLVINPTQELWIGFECVLTGLAYPLARDAGPGVDNFGNLYAVNGTWYTSYQMTTPISANYLSAGFATDAAGNPVRLSHSSWTSDEEPLVLPEMPADLACVEADDQSTDEENVRLQTRDLLGYNVYREGTLLNQAPVTLLTYRDLNAPANTGNTIYEVKTVYTTGLSEPASVVVANIPSGVVLPLPFEEGFEGTTFPPVNWLVIDNDGDGRNWMRSAVLANVHTGVGVAISASWMAGGVGALTPDNWLLTPKLDFPTLGNDDHITLEFWVAGNHETLFTEHYQVLISQGGNNVEDFTAVLTGATTSNQWEMITVNLDTYAGLPTYIAFRHYNTSGERDLRLDDIRVWAGGVSIVDPEIPPLATELVGNYPNPFNPETTIRFSVGKEGHVTLEVYNIKGQRVSTLIDHNMSVGTHDVVWEGKDDAGHPVSSGIYFYRMKSDDYQSVKRMILMK